MPKLETPATGQHTQLAKEVTTRITEILSGVATAALSAKVMTTLLAEIDSIIKRKYNVQIESGRIMENIDSNRRIIASRYGVTPSEITDEFLDKRLEEARRNGKKVISAYAKQFGKKLKPDTPQYREKLMKRVQKKIADHQRNP